MSRRALIRKLLSRPVPKTVDAYPVWLDAHVQARKGVVARPAVVGRFSLLTCVWDGSPPDLLHEAAASVFAQTWAAFEWVVLDNGSRSAEVRAALAELARDNRVALIRSPENLGIVGGLRRCLEAATGEYVLPLDADDALLPDALHVLAAALEDAETPAFAYSDEDTLRDGIPVAHYFRPDWDPVLNLCTSYAFHQSAFRREEALSLGVYADPQANWTQDWDTICRFAACGHVPLHVPGVLYHWRAHDASSTHRPTPEAGSLASQRHLLERELARRPEPQLYRLEPWPIDRGVGEWWIRRLRERPSPIVAVSIGDEPAAAAASLEAMVTESGYPFAGGAVVDSLQGLQDALESIDAQLAVVVDARAHPEGDEWPWEALGLFELHPDTAVVAGRIVDTSRAVVGGAEIFGFGGLVGSPDRGRHESDPGYWGLQLKQRSVSAPHSGFFLADRSFLREALAALPEAATLTLLGPWLGAEAAVRGLRVAFSPLVQAVVEPGFEERPGLDPAEHAAFLDRYGELVPDRRWYSRHLSLTVGYALGDPA